MTNPGTVSKAGNPEEHVRGVDELRVDFC